MPSITQDLITTFKNYNLDSIGKMHTFLHKTYHQIKTRKNEFNFLDEYTKQKFKLVESIWIEYETDQCLRHYNCHAAIINVTTLINVFKKHALYKCKEQNYLKSLSETWEKLAACNLYTYLSLYPHNKMKYIGLLTANKILSQYHGHHLLKPISSPHEIKNINNYWLDKVILPNLRESGGRIIQTNIQDFWLGFYLRFDSVQRYYDSLAAANAKVA